ncbi:MAG: hypothetical protein ACPLW9_01540 [Minisyncoccales bacterium]
MYLALCSFYFWLYLTCFKRCPVSLERISAAANPEGVALRPYGAGARAGREGKGVRGKCPKGKPSASYGVKIPALPERKILEFSVGIFLKISSDFVQKTQQVITKIYLSYKSSAAKN